MKYRETPSFAQFGEFELDVQTGEVRRHGRRLNLAGQPVQLLELFLRRPHQLIPLDELHRVLWPRDVHVDFEHGLRAAVRRLRAALDDIADQPKWIETLPRKGYRYVGPAPRWISPPPERNSHWWLSRGALATVIGIAVIAIAWRLADNREAAASPPTVPPAVAQPAPIARRYLVAVLTPDNLTGDARYNGLCERVADDIINRLGQTDANRLGVVARVESRKFHDVTELTYALRVDFVVEAAVVRDSGRLRFNVRLVRIQDRTQTWAASFYSGGAATASARLADSISTAVQSALGLGTALH